MDDPLLRAALQTQATLSFLRAQAAGCAREMGRFLHAQGCICGICDGTGEWPGGGVVAYGWLIDADGILKPLPDNASSVSPVANSLSGTT